MHHRFAADEQQIADVIFYGEVNDPLRLVQRDAFPRLRIKFRARESAESAVGIANVCDGKLQITRTAVIQNLANEFERSLFGSHDRLGKINSRRRQRFYFCRGRIFSNGSIVH